MDNSDIQTGSISHQVIQPKKKLLLIHTVAGVVGIIVFTAIGYLAAKSTINQCDTPVLGAQTSSSVVSQLASLFRLNIERPSVETNTFELAPTAALVNPQITLEPSPTKGDDDSLYLAGDRRNATPIPTQIVPTTSPENADMGGNRKERPTATPSPKYYANWDRNRSTPTPAPVDGGMEKEKGIDNDSDNRKTPTGTKLDALAPEPLKPEQVKQIVGLAGISLVEPEISTSEATPGFVVTGAIKDTMFGFLKVEYPVAVQVNEDSGEIEHVSIPWWRTLFGNPFAGGISQILCGDGICSSKEDFGTCPSDCAPVCGNGICEYGEGQDTCPVDCGFISTPEPTIAR